MVSSDQCAPMDGISSLIRSRLGGLLSFIICFPTLAFRSQDGCSMRWWDWRPKIRVMRMSSSTDSLSKKLCDSKPHTLRSQTRFPRGACRKRQMLITGKSRCNVIESFFESIFGPLIICAKMAKNVKRSIRPQIFGVKSHPRRSPNKFCVSDFRLVQ